MEEIQVCSNEGSHSSQRGDKSEIVNYIENILTSLFKTTRPISTTFGTKHPWVDGIQIFTNKGPHLPQE